jgi:hypothetical protein
MSIKGFKAKLLILIFDDDDITDSTQHHSKTHHPHTRIIQTNQPSSRQNKQQHMVTTNTVASTTTTIPSVLYQTISNEQTMQWAPCSTSFIVMSIDKTSKTSKLIGRVTKSEWSHVMFVTNQKMVFGSYQYHTEKRNIPEENTEKAWREMDGSRILLLESVSKLDDSMYDFITREKRQGIRLVDAYERLRTIPSDRMILLRTIYPFQPNIMEATRDVLCDYSGGSYDARPSTMVALLTGMGKDVYIPDDKLCKPDQTRQQLKSGKKQQLKAFCSQLTAEIFIRAGILPNDLPSGSYSPDDFSPGGLVDKMIKINGYSFGQDVQLNFA